MLSRARQQSFSWLISFLLCASGAAGEIVRIPSVTLLNQQGKAVNAAAEIRGEGVAIVNFIFTSCTTICPPMGVNFARLQKMLDERGENRIRLISITVDPGTDTPARLNKWAGQFHANSRWTLLTGSPDNVYQVLKALGVYTPDKLTHSSVAVILNGKGESTRSDTLRPPEELARLALSMLPVAAAATAQATLRDGAAQHYFSDNVLLDQDGRELRFYSDLIKGKVVLIDVIFTSCKDSCPMLTATFARLQDWLGSRLGKDVNMISISIDPETDTPQKLKAFAAGFKARPGWYFLTGNKANVTAVLSKLGLYVNTREDHSNIFLMGNDRTGLWKKAFGMAAAENVMETLSSVLRDDE